MYVCPEGQDFVVFGRTIGIGTKKRKARRPAPTIEDIWTLKTAPTEVRLESQVQEL
jgi:hypothetical protein